jgi:nicotinamide mononucleotide adenylyltransferase
LAKDHFRRSSHDELLGGYVSPVNDAYGKEDLINASHRIQMCQLALQSSTWIMVDPWEALQPCWQSTRTVLQHLQHEISILYPQQHIRIILLTGSDLVKTFTIPGLWLHDDVNVTFSFYIYDAFHEYYYIVAIYSPSSWPRCN